ncbi:hypothetical protein C8R44DRAFT_796721 [Mycena epipterygia]|nr:hypothetical protein C8R44DRAFT_796721 [Mycena epipterygia]
MMSSTRPHSPGRLFSSCHLSSKLFPRGPNDRIIVPAIRPTQANPSKSSLGKDRARIAPPRSQSAPPEYRPRQPAPPMPSSPCGYDHSRRSMDAHHAPFIHRPVPTHVSAAQTSNSMCADTASRGATMNGTAPTYALPHGDTSNMVKINGSTPTPFDRNNHNIGGQGGNGGEAGGTGGNGGTGEGNQVQIYLNGEITLNAHYGDRNRDLDFVVDMLTCWAWLGLSALALACLHAIGWFDIVGLCWA